MVIARVRVRTLCGSTSMLRKKKQKRSAALRGGSRLPRRSILRLALHSAPVPGVTDTNPERSRCAAVKIIDHTSFLCPRGARNAPLRTYLLCAQSSITPLRCSYRPRSELRKPFRHASHAALSPVVKAPQSGISPCKCRGISFSSPYGARARRFICRLTASNPAAQAAAEPHRSDPPYRLQPYTLSGSFFYVSPAVRLTRLSRAWVPASASYTIYPGTRSLRRTASGCAFDAYISPLPPFPRAWKRSVECGYVDGDLIAEDRPI